MAAATQAAGSAAEEQALLEQHVSIFCKVYSYPFIPCSLCCIGGQFWRSIPIVPVGAAYAQCCATRTERGPCLHLQASVALALADEFGSQAARLRTQVEAEQRLGGLMAQLRAAEQAADAELQVDDPHRDMYMKICPYPSR